ncbi:MAG: hypothetical protein WKF86_00475 [Acidimicrobiales bacterium]
MESTTSDDSREPAGASRRTQAILVAFVVLVSCLLVRQSEPYVMGDGGEYIAMAWQMSHGRPPSLTVEDTEGFARHINSQPTQTYLLRGEEGCCIYRLAQLESGGRYDFAHFWLYPLLAAPFVLVTRLIGFADTYAFFGLHLLLMVAVAVTVSRRAGPWATAAVLISPLVFWLDKPHTEILVFAAIALAMCWREDRPELGTVVLAVAASQNLALAPLLPLYALSVLSSRGWGWLRPRTLAALGLAAAIVAVHPIYYLLRLGAIDPQSLLGDQQFRIPSPTKLLTPLVDPYLGMLVWWPALFVLVALAGASGFHWARQEGWRPSVRPVLPGVILGLMALSVLFGAAQNLNSNHGATFSMSRYATWLAPLAVPALIWLRRWSGPLDRTVVAGVALASMAFSLIVANPSKRENLIFQPSYASAFAFRYFPTLYDPLPEVFIEREAAIATDDKRGAPAATSDCAKVLVYQGQWPERCPRPETVPARCVEARFCYASRAGPAIYKYSTVKDLS